MAAPLTSEQLALVQAVRPGLAAPVVLGVSGGADSLALAAALAWEQHSRVRRGQPPVPVEAVVVDHGLQRGSDEVADTARSQVLRLGLACRVVRGEVEASGDGPEAAARTLRRRLLSQVAHAAEAEIWLAHTRDDVAEQVLLGLARGSGGRSLAGIPRRRRAAGVAWVRPLLDVTREQTRQACLDWGLQPWDDPHNADPRFARSRVRGRVLPVLESELGPGVRDALARSARLLAEDADLLDLLTRQWLDEAVDGEALMVERLLGQPPAKISRVVRAWLVGRGVPQPTHSQVLAVVELVVGWRGQQGIDLPGGTVRRHRDRVKGWMLLISPPT